MSPRGVQVNGRDILLFKGLQKFGFLNAKSIASLYFPNASRSAVSRRLKKLFDWKLLNRAVPDGGSEYFYFATERVRTFLENDRPLKRFYGRHLLHDVGLAYSMLHLRREYPAAEMFFETDLGFLKSGDSQVLKEYRGKQRELDWQFRPDGAILLQDRALYFVEYDRSTEWGLKLYQKLQTYLEYFRGNGFNRDFQTELKRFRVLMLCLGQERIDSIMKIYRNDVALDLFVFATQAEFLESGLPLHAEIWRHVQRSGKFALGRR